MRGSIFSVDQKFFVEHCCACGTPFAMTKELEERRRSDRKSFYCPLGHAQSYTEDKQQALQRELERKSQMLEAANAKAATAEKSLGQVARAHRRMRERIMNGVCPCCNRTFQNLRQHMQTEHADFGAVKTLFALRQAFGMTQADVAREAGVDASHVSLFERDKRVAHHAEQRLRNWLEVHGADSKVPDSNSNAPEKGAPELETVAEWTGLEPATPGVTGRCAK